MFHEGELWVQERAGEAAAARRNGAMVEDTIMAPALGFLAQQDAVVVASLDAAGRPWASWSFGPPGFAASDDGTTLFLVPTSPDWTFANLAAGRPVGLLAIELRTRRRLRINGSVAAATPGSVLIDVAESFPNCPKYIQRRASYVTEPAAAPEPSSGRALGDAQRATLARADTLFLASAHPTGLDASHRGGPPGFVEVAGDRLWVPDYAGNSMFNTLGNIHATGVLGVYVPDFARGLALQLTGRAAVDFDGPRGRGWTLDVEEWREVPLPADRAWTRPEPSPFLP